MGFALPAGLGGKRGAGAYSSGLLLLIPSYADEGPTEGLIWGSWVPPGSRSLQGVHVTSSLPGSPPDI